MSAGAHRGLASALGAILGSLLLLACGSSGGGSDDEYVIALKVTEDRQAFVEETEPLEEWIADHTGTPARVMTVQDDSAQITALTTGQADAAYMSGGPAWIGWTSFDLEALAAEADEEGRTSYVAGLWVRADSDIESVADLRDRRSCHTGELAGTGMLAPIGYLIGEGFVDLDELAGSDISQVHAAREQFFGPAQIGGGYLGAFRCLATGNGEVATGRHTAWEDFCGGAEPEAWCEPREAFRWLPDPAGPDRAVEGTGGLAEVPSHPVMVSPDIDPDRREALLDAFLALNDAANDDARAVLEEVLEAPRLISVETEEHLAPYGEVLEHVPGLETHFAGPSP